MPRYRTTTADTELRSRLSFGAAYFLDQLQSWLDDKGRIVYLPKTISGNLFPYREDVDAKQVRAWVEECKAVGLLMEYEHEGLAHLWNPSFLGEQRINRPTPSRLPAHPLDPEVYQPPLTDLEPEDEDVLKPHGVLTEDSVKTQGIGGDGSVNHTCARSQELGIGTNPPIAPPSTALWWETESDGTAKAIVLTIRDSKFYESDAPDRAEVFALMVWAREFAPDDAAILRVFQDFRGYVEKHKSRKYDDPLRVVKGWIQDKREEGWRRLKATKQGAARGAGEPKRRHSVQEAKGPIKDVHFEERLVRDGEGALVAVLFTVGTDQPFDRAAVFDWFDREDGAPEWREKAERWCEAHGLRPDDDFMEEAAA